MATFIHGIGASENIDSSGEVVSIAGMDISSLDKDGVFNYEHEKGSTPDANGQQVEMQVKVPFQVVGKILKAKKIFSEQDCEDEHQLAFFKKVNVPYLYVMGELFDDYTDAAKDLAGKFRYDADKKGQNERYVNNFSVEGSRLPNSKKGMVQTKSIARKVTITSFPCNKSAIAEMVPAKGGKGKKGNIDELFKTEGTEIEVLKFETTKTEPLQKMEALKKGVSGWQHNAASKSPGVHFNHPEHGTVSINKAPAGHFEVKHNGALAGLKGQKGTFPNATSAGQHAHAFMTSVSSGLTAGNRSHSVPSNPSMTKAMEAGSGMAAPSALTQGAALTSESLLTGKKKKPKIPSLAIASTPPGAGVVGGGMAKSEIDWYGRACEDYERWEKKEAFRSFMKEKMPHLALGEIDAIGKTMVLTQSVEAEKKLSKLYKK